jgi:plasmid stabilization system protein ParE
MDIVFLASAKADLRWFKQYYTAVFPEGKANADRQFLSCLAAIRTNPMSGPMSGLYRGARRYRVSRTPFAFIYRVRADRIEIIRVHDGRSEL